MTDECRYPLYMKNDYAKVLNYNESIFFPFFISEEKIHKFSELLLFPVSNPTLELREHRIITSKMHDIFIRRKEPEYISCEKNVKIPIQNKLKQ